MTAVTRHFGDPQRRRLRALFSALGTDNTDQAKNARAGINSLLRQFGKTWADLIELLGDTAAIRPELARDIAALGAVDPDERAKARQNIADLLAHHRKTWNDLVNILCAESCETWACDPPADDPPRVNPLALVHHLLEEYVALQPHEYVAVALWALHTHLFDRFMVTPRLALRSPVPDCGKTTLFDVLAQLVARPEKFDWITTAALYHTIDTIHPTLLMDEADNIGLGLDGRLRAVFNSGHRKGGRGGLRDNKRTRKPDTFAPLAVALPDLFGGLPRALNSRCITINMERSERKLRRFDAIHPDRAFDAAYGQILLWRQDVVLNPEPEMPMQNRFADNWRPLISIADSLGWGKQAREAMVIFAHEYHDADVKILLLIAIRRVFDMRRVDCLPSKKLLEALHGMDEAEWSEFCGVRGDQSPHKLKVTELARMLREFKIRPRSLWPKNRTATSKSKKGYRRSQFEEAWRKYCAEDGTPAHAATSGPYDAPVTAQCDAWRPLQGRKKGKGNEYVKAAAYRQSQPSKPRLTASCRTDLQSPPPSSLITS
jgi:hypothetical protein